MPRTAGHRWTMVHVQTDLLTALRRAVGGDRTAGKTREQRLAYENMVNGVFVEAAVKAYIKARDEAEMLVYLPAERHTTRVPQTGA